MTEPDEISAGGVVIRRTGGGVEVVIAEQRDRLSGQPTTRLPKGVVEPEESPEQAALREVAEETGLAARVVAPLGCVEYAYRERGERVDKRVHFFLMEYVSGEPRPHDGEMRRVYWCPLHRAPQLLSFETERTALARAQERLARGDQN